MVLVKVNALLHSMRMRISGLCPRRVGEECDSDRCSEGLGRLDLFWYFGVFGGCVLGRECVGRRWENPSIVMTMSTCDVEDSYTISMRVANLN